MVTKGKPFSSGVVFVDGKFIPPPYVVERYGNVLRINKIQVTNPVVEWSEFLMTQPGAVVAQAEDPESPVVEAKPDPAPPPAPAPAVTLDSADASSLDDLFDDSPTPLKVNPVVKPAPKEVAPPKPKVRKTIVFDGEFKPNEKSAVMVNKINALRTDIDAALRRGGFFCFGSGYSRISGDKSTANRMLQRLPEIMKQNSELTPFAAAMRQAGFVYFPPSLVRDLFNNRLDYHVIQKRWKRVSGDLKYDSLMEKAGLNEY